MARRGENIYLRKDGRYEGRYIKGRKPGGRPIFGSIYARRYAEVKRRLTQIKSNLYGERAALKVYGSGALGDFLEFQLEAHIRPTVKPGTYANYRRNLTLHIHPLLGNVPINKLTPEQIQDAVGVWQKRLAAGTLRGVFRMLKAMLTAAAEQGLLSHNPCQSIRLPNESVISATLTTGAATPTTANRTATFGLGSTSTGFTLAADPATVPYKIGKKALTFVPAASTVLETGSSRTVLLGTFSDADLADGFTSVNPADHFLVTAPAQSGITVGALTLGSDKKLSAVLTVAADAHVGTADYNKLIVAAKTAVNAPVASSSFTMDGVQVAYTISTEPTPGPTFASADVTTPPDGRKYVTITAPAAIVPGGRVDVYYNYGLSSANVADPTSTSGTKYTDQFMLSDAGTYTVKAIAYQYNSNNQYIKTSAVTTALVTVGASVTAVSVSPQDATIVGRGSQVYTAALTPSTSKEVVVWEVGTTATALAEVTADTTLTADANLVGVVQPDGSFKVTAKGAVNTSGNGKYVVRAKIAGTSVFKAVGGTVRVQAVTDLDLPASITVAVGETVQIKGSAKPANATYQWIEQAGLTEGVTETLATGVSTPDATTGVSTWTVTGKAPGTTTLKFTSVKVSTSPTAADRGVSRNVTINVVAATSTPPAPYFSHPDGTVFEGSLAASRQVTVHSGVATANHVATKISVDGGVTWTATSPITIDINKTTTIWAKNVKGTACDYVGESAVTKATFKSEVAVADNGITLHGEQAFSSVVDSMSLSGSASKHVFAKVLPYGTTGDGAYDGKPMAKDSSLTFVSSNPAVAKVAYKANDTTKRNATVTGVSAGTATITAYSADGKVSKSFTVTVADVTPTKVVVKNGTTVVGSTGGTPSTVTVPAGQYVTLSAKVLDGSDNAAFNQSVTWAVTSGTDLISVTNGKVVGLKDSGTATATIKVTSNQDSSKSAEVKVKVNPAAPSVTAVSLSAVKVGAGSEGLSSWTNIDAEITVSMETATDGATIYYTLDGTDPTSSSTRIAYTDVGFKLSGPKNGKIRAIATKSDLPNSAEKEQIFSFAIPAKTITMDAAATVAKGSTLQMQAIVGPENATSKTIAWSLEPANTDIANIDTVTGLLTAKKAGVVKVVATVTGVDPAYCAVTVTGDPVATLTILPGDVSMNVLDTQQLQYRATVVAKTTAGGTWKSSDETIATVNPQGVVTAKKAGTATITLTVGGQTATAQVTVLADPTAIPAIPAASSTPTFAALKKEFSGMGKSSLSAVVGRLVPAAGTTLEQLFYYYNTSVTVSGAPAALAGEINFVMGKNGELTMHIANLPNNNFYFDYTVALTPKAARGAVAFSPAMNGEIKDNIVTITAIPTVITATTPEIADQELAQNGTVAMGSVTNFADFQATGVALTATPNVTPVPKATKDGFSAAIDANGQIILTVAGAKAGTYTVTVTVSAPGCADVTTKAVQVTVKADPIPPTKAIKVASSTTPYETSYKSKRVYVLAIADGTVTFSVPGHPVKSWKSNYTKLLSIDPNGVATLKKGGATRITVTATLEDGSKLTQLVLIRKIASEIKLQYKSGKKWVEFSESNPLTIGLGAKKKVLTRVVAVTPSGAKLFAPKWEFSDPTIAFRGSKNYINGSVVGETNVTCELYNGVKATAKVIVSASKTADLIDELDLDLEEIEEIVEVEDVQEIEEIEEIEVIEEIEAE